MIALILTKKIATLFLIMFMGVALIRFKLVKAEQSSILSVLCLYIIMPCVIIDAFQVDCTPQIRQGILIAMAAAVLIHAVMILFSIPLGRLLHFNSVETASLIYSNAAGLIVPLVVAILGKEWVIYTSAYVCVQVSLLWTHAKSILSGDKKPDIRKIITNVNIISILIGFLLFFTGLRFPGIIADAISSVSDTIGVIGMFVTGMLIGSIDMKKLLSYRRLPLIAVLRLLVIPLIILLLLKYSGLARLTPDGQTILMISLLATTTPSASTITQMAQVYAGDAQAEYASAINVVTTILCIITMPLIIALYTF